MTEGEGDTMADGGGVLGPEDVTKHLLLHHDPFFLVSNLSTVRASPPDILH